MNSIQEKFLQNGFKKSFFILIIKLFFVKLNNQGNGKTIKDKYLYFKRIIGPESNILV